MEHLKGFHSKEAPRLREGRTRRQAAGAPLFPKELMDLIWSEPDLRLRILDRLEAADTPEGQSHVVA